TVQTYSYKYTVDKLLSLEKEIKKLEDKIGNSEDSDSKIPEYWKPHLEVKVQEILDRQAELGKDGYTFAHISDFHLNRNEGHSPALLKYIMDKTNIRYVIDSGDLSNRVINDPPELLLNNTRVYFDMFKDL